MIINIRGTSGSGKTHLVRKLIATSTNDHILLDGRRKTMAHMLMLDDIIPVFLIGSYANVCGGCDTIRTQSEVCSRVRHFSQFGHVVFEGLVLSHILSRYAALDKELSDQGERYIWAYLNTSLETCLENVQNRRTKRGDDREFNPKNTIDKHMSTIKCMEKTQDAGLEVVVLDYYGDPLSQLLELLFQPDRFFNFQDNYREESFRGGSRG